MAELLADIPAIVMVPVLLVVVATLAFVVVRATAEGREVSFWPPKIGPRPESAPRGAPTVPAMATRADQPAAEPSSSTDDNFEQPGMPSVLLRARPLGLLYMASGPMPGTCYLLTEEHRSLTVGRSSHCDITIPHPLLSRTHFRITLTPIALEGRSRRGYRVEIQDLGSPNGTFVNGTQIRHTVPLHDADTIEVGGLSLTFHQINR